MADITYGTNNEFGFDYLRDNMVVELGQLVQRELHFAIVDEVDNILIDEARTPLIISGPAQESSEEYRHFSRLVPSLKPSPYTPDQIKKEFIDDPAGDFMIDLRSKGIQLTDSGIAKMERALNIPDDESIYDPKYYELTHYLDNAMKAQFIYHRDHDYVVEPNGEIVIVDEFTGRKMPGRRWSDGLHQAVEAKENVQIKQENVTLATITFQNYFRMYKKLCGMTGTAYTEREELGKIYNLDVAIIPTNRPMVRQDTDDQIYRTEQAKFGALIREIQEMQDAGQAGAGRHDLGRDLRAPERYAAAAQYQAPGAERQAARARGPCRRAGRPAGRCHDRHQYGRSRHRHPAGRQLRWPDRRDAGEAWREDRGCDARADAGGQGRGPADHRCRARPGDRARRPAYRRHRAPRGAPDRQPAAWPRRTPGRPRLDALLPLARGRADAALRPHGARQGHYGAPGRRGRCADRGAADQPLDRGRADPRRGLQLRHPQAHRPVRRCDEQAAHDHLRRPPRDPRRPGHARAHPGDDRRGGRLAGRSAPARGGRGRGMGSGRADPRDPHDRPAAARIGHRRRARWPEPPGDRGSAAGARRGRLRGARAGDRRREYALCRAPYDARRDRSPVDRLPRPAWRICARRSACRPWPSATR